MSTPTFSDVLIVILAVMPERTGCAGLIRENVVLYVETPSITVSAGSMEIIFASKITVLPYESKVTIAEFPIAVFAKSASGKFASILNRFLLITLTRLVPALANSPTFASCLDRITSIGERIIVFRRLEEALLTFASAFIIALRC